MIIYISLPITGLDEAKQRAKCELAAARLREKYGPGTVILSPFRISETLNQIYAKEGGTPTYGTYLGADIMHILDDADMVCCLVNPYTAPSKGVRLELAAAEIYGKKIEIMEL